MVAQTRERVKEVTEVVQDTMPAQHMDLRKADCHDLVAAQDYFLGRLKGYTVDSLNCRLDLECCRPG